VQRDSGASLIRDRFKLLVCNDPGSAAHHYVLRCAREKRKYSRYRSSGSRMKVRF
jgi:hypothetical protein